jgi:hypothetical protein
MKKPPIGERRVGMAPDLQWLPHSCQLVGMCQGASSLDKRFVSLLPSDTLAAEVKRPPSVFACVVVDVMLAESHHW